MRNIAQEVVEQEYERLRPTIPDFCGCAICRDDVLVYALNRLRPHYVAHPTEAVLTNLEMQSDQVKADISVLLLNGFRHVTAVRRPGHPPSSEP